MIKNSNGFSLVELMISMALLLLSLAAASTIFSNILIPFKQQTKISETNIEGIVGLDLLRRDLEHAGIGLPWNIPLNTPRTTYSEASSTTICGTANPSNYNETTDSNGTTNPPRAVISGNNNCTNNSDYLVIKAVNVATNDTCSKWTELVYASSCASPYSSFAANVCKRIWSSSSDDLTSSDYVTVILPGATSTDQRLLKANSGAFAATSLSNINSSWLPTSASDNVRIVYGLGSGSNAPKRPFNRADYYISTTNVPQKCAPNTGVLLKATMDYSGGFNQYPILDCVADMQVIYRRDTGTYTDNLSTLTDTNSNSLIDASEIREQVKEVRVYILAHEGQMDLNYSYPSSTIAIPSSPSDPGYGLGSTFNLSSTIGSTYINYRWKVYTIVVKPGNLGV